LPGRGEPNRCQGAYRLEQTRSTSDKAPDLRVIVSGVEIGAAWRRTSKDNRSYHSVKPDDPPFTAPIYANLFEGDDATGEGECVLSNQHRLLGGDTRRRAVRRCQGDRGHEGVGEVARSVNAGHAGFAALVDLEGDAEGRVDRGEAQ
jgi:uncharacterized protein (DUF736 family)